MIENYLSWFDKSVRQQNNRSECIQINYLIASRTRFRSTESIWEYPDILKSKLHGTGLLFMKTEQWVFHSLYLDKFAKPTCFGRCMLYVMIG